MRELLDAENSKAVAPTPPTRPSSVAHTVTVPRPTVPPSSASLPKPISPHTSSSIYGVTETTPQPGQSMNSFRRLPKGYQQSVSSSRIPTPTPVPQAPYVPQYTAFTSQSAKTDSGYSVMDVTHTPPLATSANASKPVSIKTESVTPMEIDLTISDDDDSVKTGASIRSRRKNAGKRRIDGEEIAHQVSSALHILTVR